MDVEESTTRPAPDPDDVDIVVAVDTTSLKHDPLMVDTSWNEILGRSRRGEVELVLSIVVIRESARHQRLDSEKAINQLHRERGRLRKLVGDLPSLDMSDLETDVAAAHEDYVEKATRKLTLAGAEVLELPEIGVDELLERDLAVRRPFRETGKGFRDTLTWRALCDHLQAAPPTTALYLVTNDVKDFAGEDGVSLHPELASEIGVHTRLFTSLDELNSELAERFVAADGARLAAAEERVSALATPRPDEPEDWPDDDRPTLRELVTRAVTNQVEELGGVEVQDRDELERGASKWNLGDAVPCEVSELTIYEAELDPESLGYQVHDELDGDTFMIGAEAVANLTIEGSIMKADYYVDEGEYRVHDWDVNDHVMLVSFDIRAELSFAVIVIGEAVEDIYLDDIRPLPPEDSPSLLDVQYQQDA